MIGLQAEILDLKANATRAAEGTVIEAKLDRGRGRRRRDQRGTLHIGDFIVAGAEGAASRAVVNERARPWSRPALGSGRGAGFAGTPEASDRLAVVESEGAPANSPTIPRPPEAREHHRRNTGMRGSLEQMMSQLDDRPQGIPADRQGGRAGLAEAIVGSLESSAPTRSARGRIHSGVGGITESDVTLSHSTGAAIIGFNVRAHKEARELAERETSRSATTTSSTTSSTT